MWDILPFPVKILGIVFRSLADLTSNRRPQIFATIVIQYFDWSEIA